MPGSESFIKPLNIKFLRAGGATSDLEIPNPIDSSYLDFIANYCSAIGAEILLQVPLVSSSNMAARVARAINILSYYIDTNHYPISWVEIGNESDLYPLFATNSDLTNWNIYMNNLTNVAAAIKSRYPSLNIVAPDLFCNYLNPGSDDLTLCLQNCGKYINAVSVHYYPIPGCATYDWVTNQFDCITNIYSILSNTLTTYGQGQFLINGECNIFPGDETMIEMGEASMGTYEGGLWMADVLGISSLQPNFLSVMPFAACAGWGSTGNFIDYTSGNSPRPIYYIYDLFSNHALSNMILCIKPTNDIRIYAYKDVAGNVSVYFVNWNRTVPYFATFNFSGGLLNNTNITYTFVPLSLTCLFISANLSHNISYTYTSVDASVGYGIETNNF